MAVLRYRNSLSISSSAPARMLGAAALLARAKTCSKSWDRWTTVWRILRRTRPRVVRLSKRTTRMTRRATSARYIDSFSPWWKSELKSFSPISFANWSLALKSAAASVENAVGSKLGRSPTVAMSWPLRSTSKVQRALHSPRNRSSAVVIAPKSSSVNDQLAAPTSIEFVLVEVGVHLAKDQRTTPAKPRMAFPPNVISENARRIDSGVAAEITQRR